MTPFHTRRKKKNPGVLKGTLTLGQKRTGEEDALTISILVTLNKSTNVQTKLSRWIYPVTTCSAEVLRGRVSFSVRSDCDMVSVMTAPRSIHPTREKLPFLPLFGKKLNQTLLLVWICDAWNLGLIEPETFRTNSNDVTWKTIGPILMTIFARSVSTYL